MFIDRVWGLPAQLSLGGSRPRKPRSRDSLGVRHTGGAETKAKKMSSY
jgi:hypothetical protein